MEQYLRSAESITLLYERMNAIKYQWIGEGMDRGGKSEEISERMMEIGEVRW